MCESLVKAVDATHDDPIKDVVGCYKRGDVVVCMPDNCEWGAQEIIPPASGGKFVIIKIPGRDYLQARKYIRSAFNISDKRTKRREFRFVLSELPNAVKNQLNTTGTYTTTWTNLRDFIENKISLLRESEVS